MVIGVYSYLLTTTELGVERGGTRWDLQCCWNDIPNCSNHGVAKDIQLVTWS